MIIHNKRPVSEIQKQRELEKIGTPEEKLAHVMNVLESNTNLMELQAGEMTMAMAESVSGLSMAMAELTTMISMMMMPETPVE